MRRARPTERRECAADRQERGRRWLDLAAWSGPTFQNSEQAAQAWLPAALPQAGALRMRARRIACGVRHGNGHPNTDQAEPAVAAALLTGGCR